METRTNPARSPSPIRSNEEFLPRSEVVSYTEAAFPPDPGNQTINGHPSSGTSPSGWASQRYLVIPRRGFQVFGAPSSYNGRPRSVPLSPVAHTGTSVGTSMTSTGGSSRAYVARRSVHGQSAEQVSRGETTPIEGSHRTSGTGLTRRQGFRDLSPVDFRAYVRGRIYDPADQGHHCNDQGYTPLLVTRSANATRLHEVHCSAGVLRNSLLSIVNQKAIGKLVFSVSVVVFFGDQLL